MTHSQEIETLNPYSVTPKQWENRLLAWGEKPVHATAILRALYRDRSQEPSTWEDLPKRLVARLTETLRFAVPTIETVQESADGTKKYLFRFGLGDCVEGVLLGYDHGYTLCVSTQRGCRMGCSFCASTGLSFDGGLTAGEIVGQWLAVEQKEGISIRNLVYMGIGEPLDNPEAVKDSLEIFADPRAAGIGARHISVSTCGVVPGVLRMAEERWPCRLAVSLHYGDDTVRSQYMPVNRRWPLAMLLDACRVYVEKTGFIVFFEYALVPGVNDQPEHARRLCTLLNDIPCRINLIRLNPLASAETVVDIEAEETFRNILREAGFVTTLRPALGQDIDGACGQLRRNATEEE